MSNTFYVSLNDISDLQIKIMGFIGIWVHEKKTKIPLSEIIASMEKEGIKKDTTVKSLKVLIEKGYIRRSFEISNKTYFVQLRTI